MGIIRFFQTLGSKLRKLPLIIKILFLIGLFTGGWFAYTKILSVKQKEPQYQTANVEKGTIISSITASGTVATSNSTSVTTQASGVISHVYVKDGDTLKAGDKVADIDLDLQGKQRSSQAYGSYQSAQNSLKVAKDKYFSLQSSMMTKWKTYMDTAQSSTYENPDKSPNTANRALPQFYSTMDDWLQTEADYKNQEATIAQLQTSLNNAWLSYQQTGAVIYAPISGTVTGLSLQTGSFITAQSNSSGGSSSQRIANIVTSAPPTITVNLTEIDTPKVKIGNKATITLDALPGKTFTGSVVSIDTVGSVSSGVTTYPTTIKLDVPDPAIFSNMAVEANIISDMKTDTLLVPVAAIQKQNSDSFVQLMTNGKPQQNAVEVGLTNDTQAEIISGLSEGDTVVTSVTNGTSSAKTTQTSSPFSVFGGRNAGGALRVGGR